MTKTLATYEAVSAVAEALIAQGNEPTLTEVRKQTLGSYSTVKAHLDRWLREQFELRKDPLPPELQQKSEAYLRSLWAVAKRQLESELRDMRAATEQSVKVARSELSDAQAEIVRLEQDAKSAAVLLAALSARLEETKLQLAREQAQNDRISEELIAEHESASAARLQAQESAVVAASLRAECLSLKEQLAAFVSGLPVRRDERQETA